MTMLQTTAAGRSLSPVTLALAILLPILTGCSGEDGSARRIPAADVPAQAAVDLSSLTAIATVDERYQSFNVEMVEVTGGRFWAPYDAGGEDPHAPKSETPTVAGDGTVLGMDPSAVFRYRPPLDLSNSRIRTLAGALAPAYMRVSGSWANQVYFHNSEEPAPAEPPPGFGSILTLDQWHGVVDLANDVNLDILLSFAISEGTRDADGVWTPDQAKAIFNATAEASGEIAAVEFMNETTSGKMQGLPADYTPEDYARDFQIFKTLVKEVSPETIIAGPSAVAESNTAALNSIGIDTRLKTEDIYALTGPTLDAFSYHYYGGLSQRCAKATGNPMPQASQALDPQWLAGTGIDADFYGKMRDRLEPGKPLWLTETAEAACGGNPWASTFIDSFRYIDQLGRLATRAVQTVMHNTLLASDYAMIDEHTLEPLPNYWAALLWRQLMGTVVLDAGEQPNPHTYVYAHCLRGKPGGVAVVALNTHREATSQLNFPGVAERYTLSAEDSLETKTVLLNGQVLALSDDGELPLLTGNGVETGSIELEPATIAFLTAPEAGNAACEPLATVRQE